MRRAACALILVLAGPSLGSAEGPSWKVIAAGWDRPTPARWRRELPAFERLGIFQGATIVPTRRTRRGDVQTHQAFTADAWRWDEFAGAVADLKAARSSTVTETFLLLYANPGDVDWFDDGAWTQVVDHWRLLARAARQGGLRGLLFDAEPYTPPFEAFNYARQAGRAEHTFAEYAAKARDRGRSAMKAVGEEFPDCVVMSYRLLCDLLPIATAEGDASLELAVHSYGLMPAFVDGWLDVLPPGVRIVEGDENAYRFNGREEFDRAYTQLRLAIPRLLSPENRAAYRSRVDVGHGIYLDAHANPPGSKWSIDLKGTTPAARLEANVASALRASDGYAWVYGESGRWWPGGDSKYPPWERKLPGATSAVLRASRPLEAALTSLDEGSTSLLLDGTFSEADGEHRPKRWWTWQQKDSRGRFALAESGRAVEARGVVKGCLGQAVPVKPGKTYAVSVTVRTVGGGVAGAEVRWKTAGDRWLETGDDLFLTPAGPPGPDGRRRLVALARAPATAEKLVLLLEADQQPDAASATFTDAQVVGFDPDR